MEGLLASTNCDLYYFGTVLAFRTIIDSIERQDALTSSCLINQADVLTKKIIELKQKKNMFLPCFGATVLFSYEFNQICLRNAAIAQQKMTCKKTQQCEWQCIEFLESVIEKYELLRGMCDRLYVLCHQKFIELTSLNTEINGACDYIPLNTLDDVRLKIAAGSVFSAILDFPAPFKACAKKYVPAASSVLVHVKNYDSSTQKFEFDQEVSTSSSSYDPELLKMLKKRYAPKPQAKKREKKTHCTSVKVPTVISNDGVMDYCITVPGYVSYGNGHQSPCIFVYLICGRTGTCYHRGMQEVTYQEIMAKFCMRSVSMLSNLEFPPLAKQ